TINPINVYELPKIIEFAKSKDTYVGFRLVHINSYYNNKDLQNFKFTKEQLEFLRSYVPKVAENYFKFHIFFRRNIPCFGFVNSVFIDSDGKAHKCIYTRNGIDGETLDKVWNNSFGRRLRSFSKCINCWSDCQTIPDLLAEYLHEKVYQKHKRL
ncbi:MAG: hypothetical protein J7L39_04230, partial [Candidatus Aenigmarchaeota archaeon]|nr:hypothetical protein [Candidatus Aenigmarchaeota archaeon]